MEMQYLKDFVVLSEELSFTKAAERLYITQSVLSKHISTLERELAAPLFLRTSRKVTLTDYGQRYLTFARKMVKLYEASMAMTENYLDENANTVLIGTIENQELFSVDTILIDFMKQYPEYHVKMMEAPNNRLEEKFLAGEFNCFTSCERELYFDKYQFIPVGTGSISAFVNNKHPLAKKKELDICKLIHETLFLPPVGTRFLSMIRDELQKTQTIIDSPFYGSYNAGLKFVDADMGVALLPSELFANTISSHVKILPLVQKINYFRGIAYRMEHLSKAEKIFLQFIKKIEIQP